MVNVGYSLNIVNRICWLDMGWERERSSKDEFESFGLSIWKVEFILTGMRKFINGVGLWGKVRILILDMFSLRGILGI